MNYKLKPKSFIAPVVLGVGVGMLSESVGLGVAVFVIMMMPPLIALYIPYAKDNPEHYWFKRKLYGFGWTPVTWQGWSITFLYIALVLACVLTLDENSPAREVFFTGILPILLLTIAFIRILYKKGESPRWQWGEERRQINNPTRTKD